MAELNLYEVTINGTKTTMRLNDADAKAYGENAKPVGGARAKAAGAAETTEAKGKVVSNKSRTAE